MINVPSILVFLDLFTGICAEELHLCGEESGIDYIRQVAMVTGDDIEVRKYKRLTSLTVLDKAVGEMCLLSFKICKFKRKIDFVLLTCLKPRAFSFVSQLHIQSTLLMKGGHFEVLLVSSPSGLCTDYYYSLTVHKLFLQKPLLCHCIDCYRLTTLRVSNNNRYIHEIGRSSA